MDQQSESAKSDLQSMMDTYSHQLQSFQHSQLQFPPDLLSQSSLHSLQLQALRKALPTHLHKQDTKIKTSLNIIKSDSRDLQQKVFMNQDEVFVMHLVKMSWEYYQQNMKCFMARKAPGKAPKKLKGILFEDLARQFESSADHPNAFRYIQHCQAILDRVKIISQDELFDTICLTIESLESFISSCMAITNDQLFCEHPLLVQHHGQSVFTYYFPGWFQPYSMQHMASWVLAYMERQVWLKYVRQVRSQEVFTDSMGESFISNQRHLNQFWANLDFNQKYDVYYLYLSLFCLDYQQLEGLVHLGDSLE